MNGKGVVLAAYAMDCPTIAIAKSKVSIRVLNMRLRLLLCEGNWRISSAVMEKTTVRD